MTEPLTSEPMLPLAGLTRPSFEVPKGACDAHMHVFGPESLYPHVPKPHYTLPDGKLDHFHELMTVLHLDRYIIVQPSFYGTDNRCMLDALKVAGQRARGVAMVEDDVSPAALEALHEQGIRGLRLDLFKRADLPIAEIQAYITAMAAKIAPLGWHLQFYVPGRVVRDLIGFLGTLTAPYVIDHMGYMMEEDGLTERDFQKLLTLMTESHCYLKLSGPYRVAKDKGYGAVAHVAKAIVETDASRAIWGSDWPHIPKSGRDTGELLNLLVEWAPDAADRQKILVDNPNRLFGFE
ncbi:putative TIM-barrel fold metal-dependent hydrolase [Shinella sp. BE166]|uniref:amidohydrolase family protein n=1 Tax=Shinella sp. BE166 TaxID=3373918 RepID=UPI003EBE29EF